jgi:ABC-2 type transport system ATP-binding protein
VALHEPDIEEVIRTFYQRRNADQRSNAKARAS